MRSWLPAAHLALAAVILVWDIVLAGRIAQLRQAPRVLQTLSGLAALLVLPALLIALATTTIITGRAVSAMDWVWPAVLVLFAAQAIYALWRRLVNFFWGIPIAVYDLILAIAALVRYAVAHGHSPPEVLVVLLAAQSTAMVFATGTPAVLASPIYINVPMVSPAFPALRKLTASFRAAMAVLAIAWVVAIIALGAPRAVEALRAYNAHQNDRLRERPNADFAVGLKILPDVGGYPSASAVRTDFSTADTLGVDAVAVVLMPDASRTVIDSVAHVLDRTRHDSTTLIVAIGYRGLLVPELGRARLDEAQRILTVRRVVSRIHPDIILPAQDPYGAGQRALGTISPERWERYLAHAARAAKDVDRRVKVGVSAAAFSQRDSTLYAWATSPGSPIDVVGFSFFPSPYYGGELAALQRAADRWMRAIPPKKEHWVFAAGGYPLAYGETSQQRVIWQALAWATDHPAIKGLVVFEAGDYGQSRGLRAPNGRLRDAAYSVMKAINGLRESAR